MTLRAELMAELAEHDKKLGRSFDKAEAPAKYRLEAAAWIQWARGDVESALRGCEASISGRYLDLTPVNPQVFRILRQVRDDLSVDSTIIELGED